MEDGARPFEEEVLASLQVAEHRVKQAEERCERLLKEATEGAGSTPCSVGQVLVKEISRNTYPSPQRKPRKGARAP